eukprot:7939196-Pyramimonas_sp.AAC.1
MDRATAPWTCALDVVLPRTAESDQAGVLVRNGARGAMVAGHLHERRSGPGRRSDGLDGGAFGAHTTPWSMVLCLSSPPSSGTRGATILWRRASLRLPTW